MNKSKIITFMEEWESQDALDRHMKSKYFQEISARLRPAQGRVADINLYHIVF